MAAGTGTDQQLAVLEQLQEFSLGRFLLAKGRLDAEHQFIVSTWPQVRQSRAGASLEAALHPLERFLLNDSPTIKAFQKRHAAMVAALPALLEHATSLAIAPGGLCEDLTELPGAAAAGASLSHAYHVHACASASDPRGTQALASAKLAATPFAHAAEPVTVKSWESFSLPSPVDLIITGTLAMNEPGITDVQRFYGQLRAALAGKSGTLVTGFLTRSFSDPSEVRDLDRIVFHDTIRTSWSEARDHDTVIAQLKGAGFSAVDIVDTDGSYATAVARV